MAVSKSFLDFVLGQLEGVPRVSSRSMFGGVGLYSGDKFFGIIDDDSLFFKVDESSVKAYKGAGAKPFRPIPDKPAMLGYWAVPVSVLEDGEALAAWAAKAIAVGPAARAKKPRRPK